MDLVTFAVQKEPKKIYPVTSGTGSRTMNCYPVQLAASFNGRSHSIRRWTHLSELMTSWKTELAKSAGFSKCTQTFLCWRISRVSEMWSTKFSLSTNCYFRQEH